MFEPCGGTSRKVQCTVCGRKGWDTSGNGWQRACLRGHKLCKRGCGRMLSVNKDGSARVHPRCPR